MKEKSIETTFFYKIKFKKIYVILNTYIYVKKSLKKSRLEVIRLYNTNNF